MRTKSVEVRPPAWGWRLAVTVVTVLLLSLVNTAYNAVQGSFEGELAVKQLSDDPMERAVGRAAAQSDLPGLAWGAEGLLLLCVWVPYAFGLARYVQAREDGKTEF